MFSITLLRLEIFMNINFDLLITFMTGSCDLLNNYDLDLILVILLISQHVIEDCDIEIAISLIDNRCSTIKIELN